MTGRTDGAPSPRRRINVTFSPPTPNGDLHLGHLAGPVLNSDVCARSQKILGHDVAFATSTDDNQTYVVTTAERLGTLPETLIQQALDSVTRSLDLAGVDVDLFERPDADYTGFVRDFFTRLWEHGAFDLREIELPYDETTGEYKAEAFVTGRCPTCLAHARAGVCEACGLYNLPGALLPVADTASALPGRTVSVWVLDLERYRSMITNWYRTTDVQLRPDLAKVVSDTLAGRLPYIPLTYPSAWGITVDWDGPDVQPQAINAWPEIYVGHVYWLQQARMDELTPCDELVQFIGIDNGFYNAFVYVTLALLAARHGMSISLPKTRTITNQYYMLEGRKFSTSKGDVRWAKDYLEAVGRDRARFVLGLTSPELQQAEFSEPIAAATIEARYDAPLRAISEALGKTLTGRSVSTAPSPWWHAAIKASRGRFEDAFRLESFSVRRAAEAVALHLEVLALRCDTIRTDDESDVSGALQFLWTLRTLGWPVTPDLSDHIAQAFSAGSTAGKAPLLADLTTPPAGEFRGLTIPPAPAPAPTPATH
ncbi:class I tRNA ligase family protein [Streptomyces sp. NPDC091649]|uniref:class I tRNA ligase family protein n=1 Tax=Streptomyces sp. NPDC091649 TaxID=3366004 RepID=UPI00381C5321